MSKRPEFDPESLRGKPRVTWAQNTITHDTLDADDAIFLASGYGLIPDAWQADALTRWMARRPGGRWVHRSCGFCVPRQNGKNGALEIRELFGLIALGEWILHTAHELKTSRKAFKRLKHFFGEKRDDENAKFPELNALVSEVRNTNGQEAIVLKDVWLVDGQQVRSIGRPEGADEDRPHKRGGLIEFATRTGGGARGTTYDLLIIDESQHLAEEDISAVRPTISSGALGNSQIIYLGTPPDPEKIGDGFGAAFLRVRGNVGKDKGLCWIEYGAPDGPLPDLDDEALLYQCNPSLGVVHGNGDFGLDLETVEGERLELRPDEYARERLGWWGNPEAKTHRGVIDMTQWRALRVSGDQDLPARGLIVVDVHKDLIWTTVALATDGPDGKVLGLVDRQEGTGGAVARVVQLVADLDKVLEVALTPAAAMFSADLTAAEVKHRVLTSTVVGDACMALQKMIPARAVAHVGQPELDATAKSARTKYVGDKQQWDRKDPKQDGTPIVAYSTAVHLWAQATAEPDKPAGKPRRWSDRATGQQPRKRGQTATSAGATRRRAGGTYDPRTVGF